MSYRQRTTRLAGTIVACATVVAMVQLGFGQQAGIDRRSWKDYGGAPDKARFVTFNQITKAERGAPRSRLDVSDGRQRRVGVLAHHR